MSSKAILGIFLTVCFLASIPGISRAAAQEPDLRISKITFKVEKNGAEKVTVQCNRVCMPDLSSLEGDHLRVIMDFKDVATIKPGYRTVNVGGKMVKQIRSYLDPKTHKLRIVLDMDSTKTYLVNPTQNLAEKTFFIEVLEKKK